jgi:hypothetical protein
MAGAWEILAHKRVMVGILHVDTTTVAWAFGLRSLQLPHGSGVFGFTGMPFDHARNTACMTALEHRFDYIFFLDSDVVPPPDAVARLMAHNKPLVSGLYCRRSPPVGVPVAIKNGQWLTKYRPGSLVEVDYVGAGCMLIHRSILETMKPQRDGKHWFDWRVDMKGILPAGECLSEDFTYCKAVKSQLGIPTLLDTSVVCKHIGYAQSSFMQFESLGAVPVP